MIYVNYRDEILKHLSEEELEDAIDSRKTELRGLVSTEACEFIIAKELGLIKEKNIR